MSAKNSFNSMDPKAMQALLAVASRKLRIVTECRKLDACLSDKLKQIFFTVYSNGDIVDYHKLFIHS